MPNWGYIAILAALLSALIYGADRFVQIILHPDRQNHARGIARAEEIGALAPDEFAVTPLSPFSHKTEDGLTLACAWLRAEKETNKAVVMAHGFGSSLVLMLKYARIYRQLGFDVLLYDHRNSGASEGSMTTMGHLEKHDLRAMVHLARQDKGKEGIVGVHGESMGAVTALLYAAMEDRPAFIAADCPFADFRTVSKGWLKARHLPAQPLMPIGSLLLWLRCGFTPKDIAPLYAMEAEGIADIPIFFAHGTGDTLIPCSESVLLYEKKPGKKALHLTKDAGHARSVILDSAGYEKALQAFLKENGILP